MSRRDDLDTRLLAAHAAGDMAKLIGLYEMAADLSAQEPDVSAASFFLTQAYVFALDQGDPRAAGLHARLKAWGREQ